MSSQIIKECNSSVQSMKRMEELIHLNKKIHFEGKVRDDFLHVAVGSGVFLTWLLLCRYSL